MKIISDHNLQGINDIYGVNFMKIFYLPRCMNCCGMSPNKKEETEKEIEAILLSLKTGRPLSGSDPQPIRVD